MVNRAITPAQATWFLIRMSQEPGYDPRNSLDNYMRYAYALELWKIELNAVTEEERNAQSEIESLARKVSAPTRREDTRRQVQRR